MLVEVFEKCQEIHKETNLVSMYMLYASSEKVQKNICATESATDCYHILAFDSI